MAPSRSQEPRARYVPLRHRRESYDVELSHLGETYDNAWTRHAEPLRAVLEPMLHRPTWYVGNGGTMAVAECAAYLHNQRSGLPAASTTSLGFVNSQTAPASGVVVISAGAKHPDTAAVVRAALERRLSRIVLVTERAAEELSRPFSAPEVQVVSLSRPGPRDGFLATNSVLNLATAFTAAWSEDKVPPRLPAFRKPAKPLPAGLFGDNLILLAIGAAWPAATDLETRLVETGLARVQKTDYRNFAHGRHVGLSRALDRTAVVAMDDATSRSLAVASLAVLPATADVYRVSTTLTGPAATLDLLIRSMHLAGELARLDNFDVARPIVPGFGRRLYHLNSSRHGDSARPTPSVARKLEAGLLEVTAINRSGMVRSRQRWLAAAAKAPISSVLLDYDGTVCTTDGRFELPDLAVQQAILRLLKQGICVGIVSGRGGSLLTDTRKWVPRELQSRVLVGLYNGAVRGQLGDSKLKSSIVSGPFTEYEARGLVQALTKRVRRLGATVTIRPHQLSVQADSESTAASTRRVRVPVAVAPRLVRATSEVVAAHNVRSTLQVKAVHSAHSVDVIPVGSSKNLLRPDLRQASRHGRALAIGDQGTLGGNDFEMLAFDTLTLSVDEVSSDPTRCWNLAEDACSGPALLTRYLRSIKRGRDSVHTFQWQHL